MDKTIQKDIGLSETELKIAVANQWLKIGIPAMAGGEKLIKWLSDNRNLISDIFGGDDRIYIRCNSPEANKKILEFIKSEKIGDEVEWIKCKESERWWLLVWWN